MAISKSARREGDYPEFSYAGHRERAGRPRGLEMKAVILAGGRGTRLAEETALRPKPMVEIGGRPSCGTS